MLYEYLGNEFQMEENKSWYSRKTEYSIIDVKIKNPQLHLPQSYRGAPVIDWKMPEKKGAGIEELYIPASIKDIYVTNQFPDLKKVEVEPGHTKFSTDGQMLLSPDGRELLYCFAAGNLETLMLAREIKRIRKGAFQHALCKKIIFGNPDVSVEGNAFDDSVWEKEQGEYCIVGNMFYRLNDSVKELRIPNGIRRFHEYAFQRNVPEQLITPVLPPRGCIADLCNRNYNYHTGRCREITITSPSAKISFNALRCFDGLRAVHITPEHKKYCSEDGIIFSGDRKCLLFYPPAKADNRYVIPGNVIKIGRSAFEGQTCLKEVKMPDTVKRLGAGAFYNCRSLQKVQFSNNLKEIPDDSVYQRGGVFENCTSLENVTLPPRLQYLGSYAFSNSGLTHITLNQKLRQIGEYALAASKLKDISLPASVERLGNGALFYAQTIHAYIGTAKGLIAAVNTSAPWDTKGNASTEWSRCMVYAQHKTGNKTEQFLVPGSLKRTAACHLDMAWNGDEIDYEEYDSCFEAITDGEERMEFAELGILRLSEEEDSPYISYMKHSAGKIAARLVEEKKEKEFLAFLQRGYLSDNALDKLLKLTNRNNLTTSSAYILKYQKARGGRKKKSFSL